MHLSPKEIDRLLLFLAAELARRRRAAGLRLNYPEARALIADEIVEGARHGRSVAELMEIGASLLTADDVLPGVPKLVGTLQVEGFFEDGQKLVTIHDPIGPGSEPPEGVEPGEVVTAEGDIELNAGRETARRSPSQRRRPPDAGRVALPLLRGQRRARFDREAAFGMRLDIPAGTAVRFEPGEEREVDLVAFGGDREVHGLNSLTLGATRDGDRADAIERARERGFLGRWAERWGADLAARSTRSCSGRRPATASASATRTCGRRSSATCSCPATSASSAAARRSATAWGCTVQSPPRTARSTSSSPTSS